MRGRPPPREEPGRFSTSLEAEAMVRKLQRATPFCAGERDARLHAGRIAAARREAERLRREGR